MNKNKQEKFDIRKALGIPKPKKCKYCGMVEGIHKTNCLFMSKIG